MRRLLRATSAILTALAVTAAAVPAQAGYEPPSYHQIYKWLPCAQGTSTIGQIDAVSTYTDHNGWHSVTVSGGIVTCRPVSATGYVYGLAAYHGDFAHGEPFPHTPNQPQPSPFARQIQISPDVHAVCLIADETTRLGCVSIGWVTVDGFALPVVEGPLAVESPLVAAPASTDMMVRGAGGPGCPACGG
ncbi:hypothetical protein [Catellatospora paridis]|uniref:hypothetical protein n=1 Tax=Catellatospora paridis TaxID=1617086 RepID=UPI0012D3ADDD|nr:hypothetical protein [Catellatospora paridis]